MKFFTFLEFIRSVLFSAATGFAFGCVYKASERIFVALRKMIFLLPNVISALREFSYLNVREKIREHKIVKLTIFSQNIYEALLFLFFGIVILLLNYATLDGVFRIYVLIIAGIFFFVSKKSVGSIFSKIFDRLFGVFYSISFWIVAVLVFPIYKFVNMLSKISVKIIVPIKKHYFRLRSKTLTTKKKKEIYEILLKL